MDHEILFYFHVATILYPFCFRLNTKMNTTELDNKHELLISDIILSGILAPIFLLLYIFVLFIIVKEWKQFQNPYYSMTVGLGLCQIVMLIRFIYTLIISYHQSYIMGETFDSFMATMAWSVGWHSVLTYQIFICLNRFVAIIFYDKYRYIFTKKLTAFVVVFSYVSGLITLGPLLIKHKVKYDFDSRMNLLVPQDKVTEMFYFLDVVFACLAGSTVLILYATAIFVTKRKLKQFRHSSSTHNRSGFMKEVKMMAQGFMVALTLVCQEVNFYLNLNTVVTLTFMLLHSGITPLIYLALDDKLKKFFVAYCRCDFKKQFKTDSIVGNKRRGTYEHVQVNDL